MNGEHARAQRLAAGAVVLCAALPACAPLVPSSGPGPAGETPSAATATRPRLPAGAAFDDVDLASAYPGARTYAGVLSCRDCVPVRLTVTIFADGTFRLREEPVHEPGAGDPRTPSSPTSDYGPWHASHEEADRIVLQGRHGARALRRVVPDGLEIVDNEGREIRGLRNATLTRAARLDPMNGPIRLSGLYGYESQQRYFVDCATRRKLAVRVDGADPGAQDRSGKNAGQAALDAAWRSLQPGPGEAVLAIVQGYLVPASAQRGEHDETLVVARFERATRNGACAAQASDAR